MAKILKCVKIKMISNPFKVKGRRFGYEV